MQTVIDDFNERKIEIEKYFDFIEKIENEYTNLSNASGEVYTIDEEHLKIFRANGFLILYNLIESTIINCIVSVFDEISTKEKNNKRIAYVDVTEKIKKYWLNNRYNHDDKIKKKTIVEQFYHLCEDITNNISLEINNNMGFGGNLNAKKIREIAERLGMTLDETHYRENLHGEVLMTIKKNRNDLAHGYKSFTTIGKDITYIGDGSDGARGLGLVHFKNYTIQHLESFIINIEEYILQEGYLIAI